MALGLSRLARPITGSVLMLQITSVFIIDLNSVADEGGLLYVSLMNDGPSNSQLMKIHEIAPM